MASPDLFFHHPRYLRSNLRRLEHLATLDLPVEGRSVLEVGAGIGDLTSFFLDRDCVVTSTEPRTENVEHFRARFAQDPLWPPDRLRIVQSDVRSLPERGIAKHDVVFCYGTLIEIEDPARALEVLAGRCAELLILEATVFTGEGADESALRAGEVDPNDLRASITGRIALPTRRWVFEALQQHFAHVYVPLTQPAFDRFRLYWRRPESARPRHRTIFVASRSPIENPLLLERLPDIQYRSFRVPVDGSLPEGTALAATPLGPMAAFENETPHVEIQPFLDLVNAGDSVCDIGAHVGEHALALAGAVGADGRVFAVEPSEKHRALFERNVRMRGLRNVSITADLPAERVSFARIDHRLFADCTRIIERAGAPALYVDFATGEAPPEAHSHVEAVLRANGYRASGSGNGVLAVRS